MGRRRSVRAESCGFPLATDSEQTVRSANGDADEVRCVDGMRSAYVCNAVSGLAL